MATCYSSYELAAHTPATTGGAASQTIIRPQSTAVTSVQVPQKDYSRPLHVDCSVEYELPNQAKPPAGVRNEPLLMIHPCYFRKIESQRRSPFVNNLPTRPQPPLQTQQSSVAPTAVVSAAKRRLVRGQQLPQQVPQQAAQYPVQYAETINRQHQLWDPMPSIVPSMGTSQTSSYCSKRDAILASVVGAANVNVGAVIGGGGTTCGAYATNTADTVNVLGHCWTEPDRSPDRPDESKHILTGKYRQYLRAHRLHPYVTSAIPLTSTFPQIHQQVCYNV